KGPGGKYTHHRGIFFGFNKTQFGDFWHCPDVSQRHDKFLADREFTGPVAARAASIVNWVSKDEQTHARDTREVTAWHVADDVLVLDYDITVESLANEPLQLHGDAHHSGFHFRAAQEVADAKSPEGKENGTTYTRPEGAIDKKNDV